MIMKYKLLTLSIVAALIYSCSSKSSVPTVEVKKQELTVAQAEGKVLYENNCGKCHQLYAPTDYNVVQWKPIVQRMQEKAQLDDAQGQKIFDYLTLK